MAEIAKTVWQVSESSRSIACLPICRTLTILKTQLVLYFPLQCEAWQTIRTRPCSSLTITCSILHHLICKVWTCRTFYCNSWEHSRAFNCQASRCNQRWLLNFLIWLQTIWQLTISSLNSHRVLCCSQLCPRPCSILQPIRIYLQVALSLSATQAETALWSSVVLQMCLALSFQEAHSVLLTMLTQRHF